MSEIIMCKKMLAKVDKITDDKVFLTVDDLFQVIEPLPTFREPPVVGDVFLMTTTLETLEDVTSGPHRPGNTRVPQRV